MKFIDLVEVNPKVPIKRGLEYPCIMMDEVKPGRKFVKGKTIKPFKGGSKFEKGDTLFARITPCLENKKIAKYNGENGNYGFGSTEFFIFRAKPNISDPDYIYYLSLSDLITSPAIASMVGASGRQRANLSVIENLDVPSPSLVNQKKISSVLSTYDNLIENNTRRIKILEETAQRIYKEWFVDFKYPGHENDKLVDSELGTIPQDWKVGKLDMIARLVKKKYDENLHSSLPLLDLSRIPRKSNSISDFGKSNELTTSRIIFKKSNILFGAIRPYFHKVVYSPTNGITNSSVFVIENKDDFSNMYLFSNLFSSLTVKWASQHSGGTKMPVISWNVFKNMPLVIPSSKVLNQFDKIISPMLQKISILIHKNQNLKQTRDYLLPKLISGKVDISDLDIDTDIIND